ncbi:MAG: hypothetical protein JXB34_00650 [Bacteroidales bacterium]|nr:hypothetical protein [Bacteroidales bacterium]
MNTVQKITGIIFSLVLAVSVNAQDKNQLLSDFTSADWPKVKAAKTGLENLQGSIIPDLIQLLDSKEKVKLTNTGNLIYPGAEKFFGHGQILDYDVDFIAIRAGWLIEEITFSNFGFSGVHVSKDEMPDFIRITFPDYYNNSANRKKIETAPLEELRLVVLKLAVNQVKEWWKENGQNFSRLNLLLQALRSFDEKEQVRALFYMRNGVTSCDGLSRDFYYDELIKEVGRLSGSEVQRISEHAKLILMDTKFEWLELKALQ